MSTKDDESATCSLDSLQQPAPPRAMPEVDYPIPLVSVFVKDVGELNIVLARRFELIYNGFLPGICTSSRSCVEGLIKYCPKGEGFVQRASNIHWRLTSTRTSFKAKAVAAPVAPASAAADNAEHQRELCEKYGYRKIGEPLPDNVTLKDIIDTLPKEVFEIDELKSWRSVLISATAYALGLFMMAKSPWYLLPLAWAWSGTAVTGFFVIGHECAHRTFFKNNLVQDIVGTLSFLPLIYPYEPWRFKHNIHHAKTNMLIEDSGWHPLWKDRFESSPFLRMAMIMGYGPFRVLMSIGHWVYWHFDLTKFRPHEMKRVLASLACVCAFMAIGWPFIINRMGMIGWVKLWLMPWLGYHFWMSTFTLVHHTAPHIPFRSSEDWKCAQAQINGTVHCDYPKWIEFLCHDIGCHIPHHISSRIPSYNLRAAHKSLQDNWGKYMTEATWNWRLMKTLMTSCHIYDKEENYLAFEQLALAPHESLPMAFLRKVMPDYA